MTIHKNDPHYPVFHLGTPIGGLNDPCGAIWRGGEYHLFYQRHARWGHAVTRDLVHWRHLPIALTATPGSCDEGGCWSGSAAVADGTPVIMYTGVDIPTRERPREWREVQCLAIGSHDTESWQKYPGNPVVESPPPDLDITDFRDPCIWKEGDDWYMIIGAGIRYEGATALMYRSPDLKRWEYLHPLCTGAPDPTCYCWECPDFFALGDRHVLLTSKLSPLLQYASINPTRTMMSTFYAVGTYRNHRFTVETSGNTDAGGNFYAAKSLLDGKGRRLLWGWVWEGRDPEAAQAAGWNSVISLPRVLTLAPDGRLRFAPPQELKVLRGHHWAVTDVTLHDSVPVPLDPVAGDCLELLAELVPAEREEFGISLRRSPDGVEQTRLVYRRSDATLAVDRSRASLDPQQWTYLRSGRLELAQGETLRLQVFLDRSVIEVFANGRLCLTSRVYPTRGDSVGGAEFAAGGEARLRLLDAWVMAEALPVGDPGE